MRYTKYTINSRDRRFAVPFLIMIVMVYLFIRIDPGEMEVLGIRLFIILYFVLIPLIFFSVLFTFFSKRIMMTDRSLILARYLVRDVIPFSAIKSINVSGNHPDAKLVVIDKRNGVHEMDLRRFFKEIEDFERIFYVIQTSMIKNGVKMDGFDYRKMKAYRIMFECKKCHSFFQIRDLEKPFDCPECGQVDDLPGYDHKPKKIRKIMCPKCKTTIFTRSKSKEETKCPHCDVTLIIG